MTVVRETLFPHQRSFVDEVAAKGGGTTVLSAVPGLGKSTALVALAVRVLAQHPDSRVLFLVPPILVRQIAARVAAQGVQADSIDRYRFRELLDQASQSPSPTTGIWPVNRVCVMSLDFAKQPDVLAALAAVPWDLVAVDEAHRVRGRRAEAVHQIMTVARQVVFGSGLPGLGDSHLQLAGAHHIGWPAEFGAASGIRPRGAGVPIRTSSYRPSEEQQALDNAVRALADNLERERGRVSQFVLRSGASSPAALLVTLQALEEGLGPEDGAPTAAELLVDAPADDEEGGWLNETLSSETIDAIGAVAERAGALEADAKVAALVAELQQHTTQDRVCVLVEYGATLSYLETCLEEQGLRAAAVHRGLSDESQRAALEAFGAGGRCLVATWAALRAGIEPQGVTHLIFYDTPRADADRDELVSSMRSLGAVGELSVVALVKDEA